MFRKELAEVLKQTGWFLAVAAVLPILLIWLKLMPGPYRAVFIPVLEAGLVCWSLFLGASLLGRERSQKAMEYALTLPHARLGLLVRLAGARFLVLVVLWLSAIAVIGIGAFREPRLLLPALAVGIGLPLFFISLSLSVFVENFIVLCLFSIAGFYAISAAVFRLLWGPGYGVVDFYLPGLFAFPLPDVGAFRADITPPLVLLQIILPVVPFIAALLLSFGQFDVRRSRRFQRRYGAAFAVGLVLCVLASFGGRAVSSSLAQKYFYLTRNLKIVEWSFMAKSMRIRDPETVRKIRIAPPILPAWDDGSFLFGRDNNEGLMRVDLSSGTADLLYRFDFRQPSSLMQWTYGSTVVFIEKKAGLNEIQLVTLDQKTKKAARYVFAHEVFRAGDPTVIGTDVQNGKRFWLCLIMERGERSTLRLWESGRVEEILVKGRLRTVNTPRFINGFLFFMGKEPIIVLQDNGRSFELKKEFPAGGIFDAQESAFVFRRALDDPSPAFIHSFIHGIRGTKLARMNLAMLEIEEIDDMPETTDWGAIQRLGNKTYFIGGSRSRNTLDVYDLNDGKVRLIRSFPDINLNRRDTRFRVFDSGIVITQGKRVGVYAFPDLKEIHYE